jgi:predicted CXXCH cytochrome family protein
MKTIIRFLLVIVVFAPSIAFAIHDDTENTKCLDCHFTLPFDRSKLSYTEDVGGICKKCHTEFPCSSENEDKGFAHPLEVTPSMNIPLDMPLNKNGMITCITCHSYHAEFWDSEYNNESLLRRTKGVKLCYTCHKKL